MNSPREKTCILCGRCLEDCPLFSLKGEEELSPRAKGVLLQELAGEKGLAREQVRKLLTTCLQCERCVASCPQQVDIPAQVRQFKARSPSFRSWAFGQLVKGFPLFLPKLAQWFFRAGSGPGLKQCSLDADLTKGKQFFVPGKKKGGEQENRLLSGPVVIFPGCVSRYGFPFWERRAQEIVVQLGGQVQARPDWQCCGFTLAAAGLQEDAWQGQQVNVDHWRSLGRPQVVSYCATCHQGLLQAAHSPLDWQPGEQEQWLGAQIFVLDLLAHSLIWKQDMQDQNVWLHLPCHLGQERLNMILSLKDTGQVVDRCCGLGGSFYLEAPGLCQQVARCLWQEVERDDSCLPLKVVTFCSGCYLQLRRTAPSGVQVLNFLEI